MASEIIQAYRPRFVVLSLGAHQRAGKAERVRERLRKQWPRLEHWGKAALEKVVTAAERLRVGSLRQKLVGSCAPGGCWQLCARRSLALVRQEIVSSCAPGDRWRLRSRKPAGAQRSSSGCQSPRWRSTRRSSASDTRCGCQFHSRWP